MEFTNQQLIVQAREEVAFWRERDELIPSQQTAIRLRLAEITLAALTAAEPVAYMIGSHYLMHAQDPKVDNYFSAVPLYAAPPAPVVPDAISTRQAISKMEEYAPCDSINVAFKYGWNACRAAMLQGAEPRQAVRSDHAEWSQSTFGDVGPVGPLKHLSKEALEAAAEPGDLSEWADMQFLLWDAQRRAGITDVQITLAMIEKLAINKARDWPEPKDGEPRLHIKKAPQQEDPQIKK